MKKVLQQIRCPADEIGGGVEWAVGWLGLVLVLALHSKLETICDLLNEGFLVYSIGNCLWDFFHRLFGLITHLKVFKKKIAEDSL